MYGIATASQKLSEFLEVKLCPKRLVHQIAERLCPRVCHQQLPQVTCNIFGKRYENRFCSGWLFCFVPASLVCLEIPAPASFFWIQPDAVTLRKRQLQGDEVTASGQQTDQSKEGVAGPFPVIAIQVLDQFSGEQGKIVWVDLVACDIPQFFTAYFIPAFLAIRAQSEGL